MAPIHSFSFSPVTSSLILNNNLIILSSTILDVKELSRDQISKMIDDCKNQLNNKSGLDDKTNYVISHKVDALSRINL